MMQPIGDFSSPIGNGYYDVNRKRAGTGFIPFTEKDFPPNFPYDRWQIQQSRYYKYWSFFTGSVWDEEIPNKEQNGKPTLRFPLKINYIKPAAMKTNYVLWGEVSDNSGPLTPMVAYPLIDADQEQADEADKLVAKEAELFVNRVWADNYGRSLQQDAGLVQQFLGGVVWRVGWQPDDEELKYKIRLEYILPDFFLPVWDSGRFNNLLEAYVVYRMPAREAALRFGFDQSKTEQKKSVPEPIYVEHWTKDSITITLDGKPISYSTTVKGRTITTKYDHVKNPFGFVPFVYIPRERAGTFYGLSIVDDLEGLAMELNARLADFGDLIHDTAQRDIFIKNVTGAIKSREIGNKRKAIDLGVTPPGTQMEPDVKALDPPDLAQSLSSYPQMLYDQFVRDSFMSGVAYGEDEGSQRSALTLAFRMWPLTSKVRAIRNNWTDGLTRIAQMIVKIAQLKGVSGITEEHLEVEWRPDWHAMVPRDREADLSEIITSVQSELLSPETGLEKLELVHDAQEEYKKVQEYMSWKMDLEMQGQTGQDGKLKKPVKRPTLGQQGSPIKQVE